MMNNTMNTMNNEMNKNNNMEGATMMNNNTITWKSVNVKSAGLGLHNKFRKAVNNKIHAVKFVINRIDIVFNKQTKQFEETSYLAIVDDSPLIREFGFNANYVKSNVLAFDLDDKQNKTARRINIDGQKYIYSEAIMTIECDNQKKIDELADKGYMLNDHKYMAVTASPSNEKHAVKYYAQINNVVTDEEVIFNKLDKLMGGALNDKLMSKLIDGKTITKANTRIGNYASGMQKLAEIDLTKERIAIIEGSMYQAYDFDETTREAMNNMGIEIDNHINDGALLLNPVKIVEIAEEVGIKLTEDEALRQALQTRWDVLTTKVMAQAKREEVLESIAAYYKADIYGCPNGPLVAVVDTDGAKMINYTALKAGETKINMYVMAVANASGVKTCNQHLIKYMQVNPEQTLATVKKLSTLALDEFVTNKLESDSQGELVYNQIMSALSEEEIYSDAFLMESIIKDAWTYAKSMISQNKFAIDGVYTHMTFDLSYAITNGLVKSILGINEIGMIEAYCPDVCRVYAEEIAEIENNDELTDEEKEQALFEKLSATVIKFPSAMADEYELVVYQTKNQMLNKIDKAVSALDVDNDVKEELKDKLVDYIEYAPFGCTIYAPINAMKNKLAGADIDFDATMCDMSELKWILINKRIEDVKANGFMGKCTFISYKDIDRTQKVEETNEVATEVDDLDI